MTVESGVQTEFRAERPIRGDLTTFLQEKFFRGAVEENILSAEDAVYIPETIHTLVSTLLTLPEHEKLFSEARMISSIAATMASEQSTRGKPQLFWKHYAHVRQLKQKFDASLSDLVREFGKGYFANADVDMDVILTDATQTPLVDVGRRIAEQFQVSQNIRKVGTDQEEVAFPLGEYTIRVLSGRSPIADIDLIKLYIVDPKDSERVLFHIDITKAGLLTDRRSIQTTGSQDGVFARLFMENGRVVYSMPKEAAAIMEHQNSFDSPLRDAGGILEVFFRGLRRSELHIPYDSVTKTDYIVLANGEHLVLPQYKIFFPLFTSESIFELRHSLDILRLNRYLRLPYNNKAFMFNLKKEPALCLQIDPTFVVQAFRDTEVASLIPGLRNKSSAFWNKMLYSLQFATDLAGGTFATRHPDPAYMAIQRERYLGWDNEHPEAQFDGLERFMRAFLNDAGASFDRVWETYLQLYDEPGKPVFRPVTVHAPLRNRQKGVEMMVNGVPMEVRRRDGRDLDVPFFTKSLQHVGETSEQEVQLTWKERIDEALQEINGNSHNPWVSQALNPDEEHPLVGERHEQAKKLRSIGYVGAILNYFTTGRTPRELEKLYQIVTEGEQVVPFNEALWELKLTGFIKQDEMPRADKHGKIVPMSIYSWEKPGVRTSFSEQSVRENLLPYYLEVTKKKFPFINLIRQHLYKGMMDRFGQYHIHSAVVAQSLNVLEDAAFLPEQDRKLFIRDIETLQQVLSLRTKRSDEV